MSIMVRTATMADKPQLMEMGRLFMTDNGVTDCEDELLSAALDVALFQQGGIIGVIGAPGGVIEAMVCLAISKLFWTRKMHLDEVMSFVRPEFRKPDGHADALIDFSIRCSSPDCPLVTTIFTNKKTQGKVQLYRRRMGCPTAITFSFNHNLGGEQLGKEFWDDALPAKTRGLRGARRHKGNGANRH